MNALILTGRVLSGMDEQQVWPKVAALFKLGPEAFRSRVLARCPITIRETVDAQEAHRLRARLFECGAEAELVGTDGSKWQIDMNGAVVGPVPLAYLKQEQEAGRLAGTVQVKQNADSTWLPLGTLLGKPLAGPQSNVLPTTPLDSELQPPFLSSPPKRSSADSTSHSHMPGLPLVETESQQTPTLFGISRTNIIITALAIGVALVWMVGHFLFDGSQQRIMGSRVAHSAESDADDRASFPSPRAFVTRWNANISDRMLLIKRFSFKEEKETEQHTINELPVTYDKSIVFWGAGVGDIVANYDSDKSYWSMKNPKDPSFPKLTIGLITNTNPNITSDEALTMARSALAAGRTTGEGNKDFMGTMVSLNALPLGELLIRVRQGTSK